MQVSTTASPDPSDLCLTNPLFQLLRETRYIAIVLPREGHLTSEFPGLGCGEICPEGALQTGKGSRYILSNTAGMFADQ